LEKLKKEINPNLRLTKIFKVKIPLIYMEFILFILGILFSSLGVGFLSVSRSNINKIAGLLSILIGILFIFLSLEGLI